MAVPHNSLHLAVKRFMDVVVAAVLLTLFAPAFLVISGIMLLRQGRPIFYRQVRVGHGGTPFTMVKFRTMVRDAHQQRHALAALNEREGPLFKATDDPRVTGIGKFLRRTSLDEVPQLLNVIRGDMSLVGPRPALPEEREQFTAELRQRELMPQGLTGLWQVDARHDADFERYRQLDLDYVRHWSLWRDLVILARTPFVVAQHALRHAPLDPGAAPEPAAERAPARERELAGTTIELRAPAHALVSH